ncbi:DEKNAAC102636, partial [Brettanomyces naardenensis]
TPDPYRRLRQHNGELSKGGAWRTRKKGYRPWRMVMFVHGFPSNVSALQFEHAWQHAYQTRHIPPEKRRHNGKRNTGSGTNVNEKLANCRLLLGSKSFCRLGLKTAIFDKEIYGVWLTNKFHIPVPDHVLMEIKVNDDTEEHFIEGGNYVQVKSFMTGIAKFEREYADSCIETIKGSSPIECSICKSTLDPNSDLIGFCFHDNCSAAYHLGCWSKRIVAGETGKEREEDLDPILPIRGPCTECKKINFWNIVVRNAMNVREMLQKDGTHIQVN